MLEECMNSKIADIIDRAERSRVQNMDMDSGTTFISVGPLPLYYRLVSPPAIRLFLYLSSRGGGLVSYLEIQEQVGIRSKTTIRKSFEELEALGWIYIEPTGRDEKGRFASLCFELLPIPMRLRREAADLYQARLMTMKARADELMDLIEKCLHPDAEEIPREHGRRLMEG